MPSSDSSLPDSYSFVRYLTSKRTVDDRALNRHVWEGLSQTLVAGQNREGPTLQVLEVGAGIGTMIERCLEADLLTRCTYTAIDADAANIRAASRRLPQAASRSGFRVAEPARNPVAADEALRFGLDFERPMPDSDGTHHLQIDLQQADLFDFARRRDQQQRYDLLIAHAFMDLVETREALQALASLLRPRATLYLTINFDGATILEPAIDRAYDSLIQQRYHQTMDARLINGKLSGDSQTGRHLFGHLRSANMEILAAGSSDWVVFAGPDGYEADEAYFLHFIIETMRGALADDPHVGGDRYQEWIRLRHEQIERGELVYIAHQIDFMARLGP